MIPPGDELARAAWAQAWQVTMLIVVVGVLTRFVARNRPHAAHALWLIVLMKCVTPPVWSSTSGVFCWLQSESMERSTRQPAEVARPAGPPVEQESVLRLPEAVSVSRVAGEFQAAPGPSGGGVVLRGVEFDGRIASVRHEIEAKPSERSHGEWMTGTLLGGWVLGMVVVLGVSAVRWAGCLRRLRRSGFVADRSYDRLMASLSRRLKLWQPASLVVTTGRLGPAVIGLLRPTVVLPEVVVRGKSAEDLEPILAHELIHVRRGDVWTGVLQMLGQAVWWFHPLVWWAGRLASREAERCCDEAVVAELGCSPARYARCLLDVLERKQDLNPLPAFPGVRPVEVTSRRMERIMRLGQGSRKRSPWWCWAVMALAAAVTLPGAALVVGADDDGSPAKRSAAETPDLQGSTPTAREESKTVAPLPYPSADGMGLVAAGVLSDNSQPQITRAYEVDDLLAGLKSDRRLDREQAQAYLLRTLGAASLGEGSAGPMRRLGWSGNKLLVRETARGQKLFAAAVESVREHGFDQIQIEVYFMSGTPKMIETLDVTWKLMPTEVFAAESLQQALEAALAATKRPLPHRDLGARRSRARVIVEKNLALTSAVLNEKQMKAILERFQEDRRANILQAPKVRLFNGGSTHISDSSQRPFVVGLKDGKPQIRVLSEGTLMRLRSLLHGENSLQIDYELTVSKINDVETFSFFGDSGEKPVSLQLPELETVRLDGSVELPTGNALLIGGLKTKDAERPSMLVMVRATKVEPQRPVARNRDLYTQTYVVADLVVPLPQKVVPWTGSVETTDKPKMSSADFDSLIDLITSTISPSKWDIVGGRGSIAPFETNLSLVVSQTQEVHEEIVDLLEQLRRSQDLQVALDAEIVRMPGEMVERIGIDFAPKTDHTILAAREARMFRAFVEGSKSGSIRPLAKMMVFNGQLADIALARPDTEDPSKGDRLQAMPVVTKDRRSVRLTLAHRKNSSDASADYTTAIVDDGRTLLLDVTGRLQPTGRAVGVPISPGSRVFRQIPNDSSSQKTFLLVTPRIVVVEEEEERVAASPR